MTSKLLHVSATSNGLLMTGALQAALDALDCQIAVLAGSGDVVVVNEAWRKLAESDINSATHIPRGRNYLQAFRERGAVGHEAQEWGAGVHAVLTRRKRLFSLDYPWKLDGQQRWLRLSAAACEISGSPHAIVVQYSITPERHTEDELRALLMRKEEFLATLLHELRNPLAPISTALELLKRRPDDLRTVINARSVIQRQVRQITRLVDDLFDISRVSRSAVEIRIAPVDLADVVEVAVEAAQKLIDLRRHTLIDDVEHGRFIVNADSMRLGQVLTNLLINAAKYTNEGGQISIVAEQAAGAVLVHVRDSGAGIEPEQLDRVFDLFARAGASTGARTEGLGVGLAVARELMQLQGGSISVRSEGKARGSEFTISIPRP
jgi:signal transduction histidine kinase